MPNFASVLFVNSPKALHSHYGVYRIVSEVFRASQETLRNHNNYT